MEKRQVGILLFNEVEVLDFAGPFEVFSLARDFNQEALFQVHTITENGQMIRARNGLKVLPDYNFSNCPQLDILLVPGGYGAEEIEMYNESLLSWITEKAQQVEILASVCTGALLLAQAGFLKGKKATTHWMDLERLANFPEVDVQKETKYVEDGKVITSGGISAGIDMSFYLVAKLYGVETALATAKRMEYDISLNI